MDIVTRASIFAATAHQGQKYGTRPYIDHCADVVRILETFGYTDPSTLAAGWLHDVIEDTAVTYDALSDDFGTPIALTVYACTGAGETRKERNASIYAKIGYHRRAIPVKIADRIANVESCWATCDSRLFMYRDEYPEFRRAVRSDDSVLPMLRHLDTLMGRRSR